MPVGERVGPGVFGVSTGGGGGSGTVTSVSGVNANGFTFSIANPTTTPAITLSYAPATGAPSNVTPQSANYSAAAGDIVLATAGVGGFTVTLPASTINRQVTVKKVDGGAGTITITPTSGTIDGAASATIVTRYVSMTMVADGTNWNQI